MKAFARMLSVGLVVACCHVGHALAAGFSAISPDGHYEARVKATGPSDQDGVALQSLVLLDRRTGAQRTVLNSRYSEDHTQNLTGLHTPLFSLDGGYVYLTSEDVSPYRPAVHQINIRTGQVRYVTTGWALSVIRSGPYRGYLLVQKHRMIPDRSSGTYNPVFVMRPDGREEMVVPGSANEDGQNAVGPWLARRGWRAW